MAHCGSKPKKMEKGGAISDRDAEIAKRMLKKELAAKKSRQRLIRREMGKDNMTQSDMDYIEKGPKFFKDGGAAFPDLTGDGKVTKKDILKGRGVKGFKDGGAVCRGMGAAMRGGKYTGCK